MYQPYHVTASANIAGAVGGTIHSVLITGGANAATVTLKEQGASGVVVAVLKAGVNTSVSHNFDGAVYSGQLYALITGTTPDVTIEVG